MAAFRNSPILPLLAVQRPSSLNLSGLIIDGGVRPVADGRMFRSGRLQSRGKDLQNPRGHSMTSSARVRSD